MPTGCSKPVFFYLRLKVIAFFYGYVKLTP